MSASQTSTPVTTELAHQQTNSANESAEDLQKLGVPSVLETATAVIDCAGKLLAWTAAAERFLGHHAGEVVGKPFISLLAGGGDAEAAAAWRARVATRAPWSDHLHLRCRDGSVIRALVEAQPLIGEGGTDWLTSAVDPSGTSAWPPARSPVAAALLGAGTHRPVHLEHGSAVRMGQRGRRPARTASCAGSVWAG